MRYGAEDLAAELGSSFDLVEAMRHEHCTPTGDIHPLTYALFRVRPLEE